MASYTKRTHTGKVSGELLILLLEKARQSAAKKNEIFIMSFEHSVAAPQVYLYARSGVKSKQGREESNLCILEAAVISCTAIFISRT